MSPIYVRGIRLANAEAQRSSHPQTTPSLGRRSRIRTLPKHRRLCNGRHIDIRQIW